MAGFRAFIESLPRAGETLSLPGDEAHHLTRVLRAKTGDRIELFNGAGGIAPGIIASEGREVRVCVEEIQQHAVPPRRVCLAVGLPKGKTSDLIVRQGVEFGVSRIVFLFTRYSEVRLEGERLLKKTKNWRRTAIEAAKQSGAAFLPAIEVSSGRDFLEHPVVCGHIASLLPEAPAFDGQRLPSAGELTWLIGPEGDFHEIEYRSADAAGYRPVRLGENVLRTETAVTAACALTAQWQLTSARLS